MKAKEVKTIFLCVLIAFAFGYLIASFCYVSFNVSNWTLEARFLAGGLCPLLGFIFGAMLNSLEGDK